MQENSLFVFFFNYNSIISNSLFIKVSGLKYEEEEIRSLNEELRTWNLKDYFCNTIFIIQTGLIIFKKPQFKK